MTMSTREANRDTCLVLIKEKLYVFSADKDLELLYDHLFHISNSNVIQLLLSLSDSIS